MHEWLQFACSVLFHYASNGLRHAIGSIDRMLQVKWQVRSHLEAAYELYINLVSYHSKLQSTPPALLRSAIRQAIGAFPNNPEFLLRFVELERHSQLDNRLRRYFDQACANNASVMLYLFSIQTEVGREGANHRIVSLFEKALETSEYVLIDLLLVGARCAC
jgi:hypothetical protein